MTDQSEDANKNVPTTKADGEKKSKSKNMANDKVSKDTSKTSKTAKVESDAKSAQVTSSSSDKPLNKRQRQQLKRKARLEAQAAEKQKRQKTDDQNKSESSDAKEDTKKLPQHESSSNQEDNIPSPTEEELLSIQSAWATPLHSTLISSLYKLNYSYPTPIQSATLSAAILGRRDIVGAAPTGSGKTLSYGLPILQWLLENAHDEIKGNNKNDNGENDGGAMENDESKNRLPLQALILVPTREVSVIFCKFKCSTFITTAVDF